MKQILMKKPLKELETLFEKYYGEKRKTKRTKKKQQQKLTYKDIKVWEK